MQVKYVAVVGAIFVLANSLQAQEMVENPEFTSWSKAKKGTSVSMKSSSIAKNRNSEVIITVTLNEVGPEKLVLESTSLVKMKDKDFKTEPEKRDVVRLVPLPKGLTREDFAQGKPPGTTAEGVETLAIGGLELKAKWYKYKADVAGLKIEGKRWVSSEVPGSIAKNEMTTSGEINEKTTIELIEIKKP